MKMTYINSLSKRSFSGSCSVMLQLLLLTIMLLTVGTAKAQIDSTMVNNDSVAWKKSREGMTVTAQRQLIKQEIDRIGYDVQADEDSKTKNVLDMLKKIPMVTIDGEDKRNSLLLEARYDDSDNHLGIAYQLDTEFRHVNERVLLRFILQ